MLSNDEQAAYMDAIERVRQRVVNHLSSNRNTAVDFIATLHRAVDKVVQQADALNQKTECKPGCACCCSVRVEATEPEIFRIAGKIRSLPAVQINSLLERLRNFTTPTVGMSRPDCAFLDEHLCSIYEVRPAVCRRAHSLSAESCKRFTPEIPQNMEMILRANALMKGTSEAYRQVGLHASGHELCRAVLLALTDETTEIRWCDGESVFSDDRT